MDPTQDGHLIEINKLSKTYGGVHALRNVHLRIERGEVHALCGANGAGKSTLIKILSGATLADSGTIHLQGSPIRFRSVRDAEEAGIAVIHQESMAFLDLNVIENLFVGREPKRWGGLFLDQPYMARMAKEWLRDLGEELNPRTKLADLTVAQRQMVSIARAASQRCRLLIMDEPTASLSVREANVLFRIIRKLRSEGVSVLYVSHRMDEVFELSDQITVLRDGQSIESRECRHWTLAQLVSVMIGDSNSITKASTVQSASLQSDSSTPAAANHSRFGETILAVDNLCCYGEFENISFTLKAGEIVGLAGLVGAGRSEVAQSIFGARRLDRGTIQLEGKPLVGGSIRAAVDAGIALIPEDRQLLGLILPMGVRENLSLAILRRLTRFGIIQVQRQAEVVKELAATLQIKTPGLDAPVESLSGGNQQKVLIGKWLACKPKVLLLDEPTRGVDVGAKREVHRMIREAALSGMATLVISSETPELLALCDRILVMCEGELTGELSASEADQQKILELSMPQSRSSQRALTENR